MSGPRAGDTIGTHRIEDDNELTDVELYLPHDYTASMVKYVPSEKIKIDRFYFPSSHHKFQYDESFIVRVEPQKRAAWLGTFAKEYRGRVLTTLIASPSADRVCMIAEVGDILLRSTIQVGS